MYAAELFGVPPTLLRCSIIVKCDTTKSKVDRTVFTPGEESDSAAITVWFCSPTGLQVMGKFRALT
jgi:hypothetical protein